MNATIAPDTTNLTTNPVPSNPQTVNQPSSINNHPAIARLPKATRDMINLMLDDALPYHVILDELAESGRGLTAQSLAEWVQTGRQHYLQQRQSIESAKAKAEFAADLVRELGQIEPSVIHRACMSVVAIQIFAAIMEHGDKALVDMLRTKPASYIAILNALCNLTNTTLKLEHLPMAELT